jgi:TonB family protein
VRRAAAVLAALLAAAPPGAHGDEAGGGRASAAAVQLVDALPAAPSVAERLAEIRRRIQAALVYPSAARRRGLEGVARVQFEIGAGGRADQIAVVRSSGHALLDRAARESVVAAGVLPRVYGRLQVPVQFALEED